MHATYFIALVSTINITSGYDNDNTWNETRSSKKNSYDIQAGENVVEVGKWEKESATNQTSKVHTKQFIYVLFGTTDEPLAPTNTYITVDLISSKITSLKDYSLSKTGLIKRCMIRKG